MWVRQFKRIVKIMELRKVDKFGELTHRVLHINRTTAVSSRQIWLAGSIVFKAYESRSSLLPSLAIFQAVVPTEERVYLYYTKRLLHANWEAIVVVVVGTELPYSCRTFSILIYLNLLLF